MKQVLSALLLLALATGFISATRTITGVITDESGRPVPQASIIVKGSQKGVTADTDGKFSIEVGDKKNLVLQVSALGFNTREISIGTAAFYTIRLTASTQALQEVVVAGYGAARKKDMTGSVTVPAPPPNIQSLVAGSGGMLNGQVMGLQAGPAANIRLRGYSSMGAAPVADRQYYRGKGNWNREGYDRIVENQFLRVTDNPLSTFSIDVDAASYANIRRMLNEGRLPEEGAVRIEEMINYFSYEYTQPANKDPFAVHMELGACPWNEKHQLALIGLQGKKIDMQELPPSNLTFLIDVSGSMMSPDKLPLVKQSLKLLVDQLRPFDRVSLVAYAGMAGLVLEPTPGDHKVRIKEAIDRLEAGGSTAGGMGIQLAYKTARQNFMREGNNRVILCTDGDFNVGLSSDAALEGMIEEERKSGVFLTVLGFGTGNYQDAKMQKLADKGNGNHAYIDQLSEAKKVLISEFGGTLFTIAKDVKLQVEFNPAKVAGYRLIGYENRMLAKEDFNNDQKDAGELGSGHTVTALYEIVPAGVPMPVATSVDSLRYQVPLKAIGTSQPKLAEEVLNVKIRYKQPDGDKSSLLSFPLKSSVSNNLSANFRFAAAVASFGMLLRHSEYRGSSDLSTVTTLAKDALGADKEGYRKEFLQLVEKASLISRRDIGRRE